MTAATAALAALTLSGCASTPKSAAAAWIGGEPAHLNADISACRTESSGVDVNQATGYSDSRYGVTSAMAAAIAKDNPLTDTRPQIKAAAFSACMNDKGWREP